MARSRSFDGDYDDLPLSIQRALRVDRSFYDEANCRTVSGTPRIAWVAAPGRTYTVGANRYSGEKLVELALLGCATCPVQWECSACAIEADERAGIWGDTLDNLKWLSRLGGHEERLKKAKAAGVTVQRAIFMLRYRIT